MSIFRGVPKVKESQVPVVEDWIVGVTKNILGMFLLIFLAERPQIIHGFMSMEEIIVLDMR